jgi:hypothetical protein
MKLADMVFSLPADLELWLILGYVAVVLFGARAVESMAQFHFARARRHAEEGFEFVADEDHYRCPEGERLSLQVLEPHRRLAVYQAPAERCNNCRLKAICTPHDDGRRVFRSLATWAESDVGRFHQRLSLLMFGAATVLTAVGLGRWGGGPGTGLLALAFLTSLSFLVGDWWKARHTRGPDDHSQSELDAERHPS